MKTQLEVNFIPASVTCYDRRRKKEKVGKPG